MLELHGVKKVLGKTTVLHGLDLAIQEQRTTVLIGPSGCGKSTVLRTLIGLLLPDQGRVTFQGEVLAASSLRRVRHRMGYVIQDGGLFPHLSARRNVTLLAKHLGWTASACEQRLAELTDLVRLPPDVLDRVPAELSGGQQQRVGLMRALMLDPDVLLMDEPLASLDPMVRHDLQQDLRQIFRSLQKTVVLVTHDLAEAEFFADEVVLLKAGTIVQQGSARSLFEQPASDFVRRFVQAQRGHRDGAEES